MTVKETGDMNELIVLKEAAAEIRVDPSYLRRRISEGKLKADKYGGRDWWIRRYDLKAFDEGRQPVGRPPDTLKPASPDATQQRKRTYEREYRRKYRKRQEEAAQSSTRRGKGE